MDDGLGQSWNTKQVKRKDRTQKLSKRGLRKEWEGMHLELLQQPTNDDADDNAFMDKEGRKRHSAQDVNATCKEEIQEHYEMRSKRLNFIGLVCYRFQREVPA